MSMDFLYRLDRSTPIPLYYQIKQNILSAIGEGRLQSGDLLPTEYDFCEACSISRPTVRQAMNELVQEGILYRLKGKGTYVSAPKIDGRFLNKLQSFQEEMRQKGLVPTTRVLRAQVMEGKPLINAALHMDNRQKLVYLERVRCADSEPLVYVETYLPYRLVPGILDYDFARQSLYEVLQNSYGLQVTRADREIEAVNATEHIAALLQTTRGRALSLVTTVAYTREGTAVEYSMARYRGDRNKFSVRLYREEKPDHSSEKENEVL